MFSQWDVMTDPIKGFTQIAENHHTIAHIIVQVLVTPFMKCLNQLEILHSGSEN